MTTIFWVVTVLLALVAQAFFLPWVKQVKVSMLLALGFLGTAYGLYAYWGNSHHLSQYYSEKEKNFREHQPALRALLTEFKKEEYRLRLRLEENANDKEALEQLKELLKVKALF